MVIERNAGFTLAEVLIALALLGITAAFSIPKILVSVQDTQKKAVFRETYAAVSQVMHEGVVNQTFHTNDPGPSMDNLNPDHFINALKNKLNAVQYCPTNYVTENCYPDIGDNNPAAGMILPNGAAIMDIEFQPCTPPFPDPGPRGCGDLAFIDWNGPKPPNQWDDDIICIGLSYGEVEYQGVKPGAVGPCYAFPAYEQAYKAMFE